jgi:5-methylcytosine-specific restriction endonuclease McrA
MTELPNDKQQADKDWAIANGFYTPPSKTPHVPSDPEIEYDRLKREKDKKDKISKISSIIDNRFCPKCGKPFKKNDKVCRNKDCGYDFLKRI